MNAEQIARKTLEPGDGHYAALTSDEIYSLCRAVLDVVEYRKLVESVANAMRDECADLYGPVPRCLLRGWIAKLTEEADSLDGEDNA